LSLLSYLHRRPPGATPLPYTPLFRSALEPRRRRRPLVGFAGLGSPEGTGRLRQAKDVSVLRLDDEPAEHGRQAIRELADGGLGSRPVERQAVGDRDGLADHDERPASAERAGLVIDESHRQE